MSSKSRRIIAIVALVFVGLFSVSFVMYLLNSAMFNGAIGYIAMFTGGIGLALFLVVYFSRKSDEQFTMTADEDENPTDDSNEKKD